MHSDQRPNGTAPLGTWLLEQAAEQLVKAKEATDAEDTAFHEGMHDAFMLTMREVHRVI